MNRKFRLTAVIMIVFAFLLSGCSRKQADVSYSREYDYVYDDYYVYDSAEEPMMDMEYAAEESAPASAYSSKAVPAAANGSESSAQKRMIQKSATITIQVMDPLQTADAIISMTEQMGGFVVSSSSSQERYSGDIYLPKADLSIRVPAEQLLEMLAFIEEQTTDTDKYVSNKRIYGVDITSDYVDTGSRLTSLETTRDKLYDILDTAADASEALEIYTTIADVEGQIEVLKGQIKYMEESVALSSIEIRINSIKPAPTQTVQRWSLGEVFSDAFETLLNAGKGLVEIFVYILIVVIPILILLAIPVVALIFIIKRLRKNRKAAQVKNGTEAPKEDVLTEVKK